MTEPRRGGAEARFDLTGRTALVTGGGGILGRRFCRALAEHGAHVAVLDIDGDAAEDVTQQLRDDLGQRSIAIEADVTEPVAVTDAVARVERELGPLRIVCNNAATKGEDLAAFYAPFEEYTLTTWRQVTAVNLDAMFLVAQAAGRAMLAHRQGGSIVQTSSVYGLVASDPRIYEGSLYEGQVINSSAAYAATKAGVVGLTRHLAVLWAGRGIRVNALAPGGVESGQNETFQRNYAARVPLGRMAQGEEIAAAAVFLASDAAGYVTGQVLAVDGGLTAW